MRYIRTTKNIYKIWYDEDYEYVGKPYRTTSMKESELVLKQADTLEKLCDVYAIKGEFGIYLVGFEELDRHAMG